MEQINIEPSVEVIETAKLNPNGWVYQIDGRFDPSEYVPPEGILGAWKVDANGNIEGEFILNPKYKSQEDDSATYLDNSKHNTQS